MSKFLTVQYFLCAFSGPISLSSWPTVFAVGCDQTFTLPVRFILLLLSDTPMFAYKEQLRVRVLSL